MILRFLVVSFFIQSCLLTNCVAQDFRDGSTEGEKVSAKDVMFNLLNAKLAVASYQL